MVKNGKVGFFVDLPNLYRSLKENGQRPDFKSLRNKASEHGTIIEARAYGDFSRIPFHVQKELLAEGIRLIHCPGNQNGETKLDDPLMVEDIHDSLIQRKITTFVLVTGDAHFAPLVTTLRYKYAKKVVVFGVSSATSGILRECADEFVSLSVENDQENMERPNERQALAA